MTYNEFGGTLNLAQSKLETTTTTVSFATCVLSSPVRRFAVLTVHAWYCGFLVVR